MLRHNLFVLFQIARTAPPEFDGVKLAVGTRLVDVVLHQQLS